MKNIYIFTIFIFFLISQYSGAGRQLKLSEKDKKQIAETASFEFDCPKAKIQLTQLPARVLKLGAKGCGIPAQNY